MKCLGLVFVLLAIVSATPVAQAAAAKPANPPAVPAVVDSLVLLERSVARDSTKFDNLYRLGIMYLDREKNLEAAQVFLKANQVKPKNVKVLVNLGVALDNLSKSEMAQVYYREAIKLSPADPIAGCRLATSLHAEGKFTDSMALLRELVARDPQSQCAYYMMGVAFADAGLYRDAIRMWKKVIEVAPTSAEAQSARENSDVLERFLAGQ